MKLNKEWHLEHKMPKKPSVEQQISWHLEHQKYCQCAPIPKKLLEEIKKRNLEI